MLKLALPSAFALNVNVTLDKSAVTPSSLVYANFLVVPLNEPPEVFDTYSNLFESKFNVNCAADTFSPNDTVIFTFSPSFTLFVDVLILDAAFTHPPKIPTIKSIIIAIDIDFFIIIPPILSLLLTLLLYHFFVVL